METDVRCYLLTGISGVGKSTVTRALASHGIAAIDFDSDAYSHWVVAERDEYGSTVEPDRDWVWREDRVRDLLEAHKSGVLFVSGCASNMGQFLPRFDCVILLSVPPAIVVERLRTRLTNAYGKQPHETARVLEQIHTIEPLLRRIADHEINTDAELNTIVDRLIMLTTS